MSTFEYLIASCSSDHNQVQIKVKPDTYLPDTLWNKGLDWLGKDGWELVSSSPIGSLHNINTLHLIFKRERRS